MGCMHRREKLYTLKKSDKGIASKNQCLSSLQNHGCNLEVDFCNCQGQSDCQGHRSNTEIQGTGHTDHCIQV